MKKTELKDLKEGEEVFVRATMAMTPFLTRDNTWVRINKRPIEVPVELLWAADRPEPVRCPSALHHPRHAEYICCCVLEDGHEGLHRGWADDGRLHEWES